MIVKYDGVEYEMIRASDIDQDGMWLEFYDNSGSESVHILSAFWSDKNGSFIFHSYRQELPFEVVETFVKNAREALPPKE